MAEKAKRSRAANFTPEEKLVCLNVVKKYKEIVESKETGAVSWQEKENIWNIIEEEFNCQSPSFIYRSVDNLKSFYNNKKKEVRKIAAAEKNNWKARVDGSTVMTSDPVFEITLDILNKSTGFDSNNKCDSDAPCQNQSKDLMNMEQEKSTVDREENASEIPYIMKMEQEKNTLDKENTSEIAFDDKSSDLSQQEPNSVEETTENNNRDSFTSQTLDRTKNSNLQNTSNTRRQKWTSRRRPQAFSLTENIALKYDKVANMKAEIAKVQLELLNTQKIHEDLEYKRTIEIYELKKKRYLEEFQLRKKALLLDIEIKEAQLRKLLNFHENTIV